MKKKYMTIKRIREALFRVTLDATMFDENGITESEVYVDDPHPGLDFDFIEHFDDDLVRNLVDIHMPAIRSVLNKRNLHQIVEVMNELVMVLENDDDLNMELYADAEHLSHKGITINGICPFDYVTQYRHDHTATIRDQIMMRLIDDAKTGLIASARKFWSDQRAA